MVNSVNYLMSGDAHSPYLVASLVSLRKHYGGKVVVHAYPESFETVKRIAEDRRLGVTAILWEPFYRGKNGQFINKIRMMRSIKDSGIAMYLDADTMVAGSLDFPFAYIQDSQGFVGTQFCDWMSNIGTVRNRVSRLIGMTGIDQEAVHKAITRPLPSLNGGVFFCKPNSSILPLWEEWSLIAKNIFICDETVLHAVAAKYYDVTDQFSILIGGRYNCSPKYRPAAVDPKDVVIWHGHGDAFVRPNKCKAGVELWWPAFVDCLMHDFGGVQEWLPKANNRFLSELLKENGVEL